MNASKLIRTISLPNGHQLKVARPGVLQAAVKAAAQVGKHVESKKSKPAVVHRERA